MNIHIKDKNGKKIGTKELIDDRTPTPVKGDTVTIASIKYVVIDREFDYDFYNLNIVVERKK